VITLASIASPAPLDATGAGEAIDASVIGGEVAADATEAAAAEAPDSIPMSQMERFEG